MDFFTNAYLSLAIGIGALIGRIRFRKTDPAFYPFLYLVWAGFFYECTSIVLLLTGHTNVVLFNVYVLVEALLLCWQFHRWGVVQKRFVYAGLQGLLIACWGVEWLATSLRSFSSYFTVFYSIGTVLLSISCINRLLFQDFGPLLRNPVFLLCACFLLYFGFSALVEIFWMTDLAFSGAFRRQIHALLSYVNLFTNLVFIPAILWMPMRSRFIMLC